MASISGLSPAFFIRLACLAHSGTFYQHCTGAPAPSTGCTVYKRRCHNKHDLVLNSVGAPLWNESRHNAIAFGLVWIRFGLQLDSVWTRCANGFPYLKLEMQNHCWTSFGLGLDSDWTRPKRFDPSISGEQDGPPRLDSYNINRTRGGGPQSHHQHCTGAPFGLCMGCVTFLRNHPAQPLAAAPAWTLP